MTKRIKLPSLKSREDFIRAVDEAARCTVELRKIEAAHDANIQAVQTIFGDQMQALQAECNALVAQAEKYAVEHRDELLLGKLKSDETPLATFGFRTGMPALKLLSKWTWEKVLDALNAVSLRQFIRNKPEVDKAAIIAATDKGVITVAYREEDGIHKGGVEVFYHYAAADLGIRVAQDETFYIEPKLDDASQVKPQPSK
jgi:phage host-nuclease inhibitor protein Gam